MSVPIRTRQTLHDPIGRAHRRATVFRCALKVSGVLVLLGGLGWGGWFLWAHRAPRTPATIADQKTPIGVWCRGQECAYFDVQGAQWGSPVRSRGALLVLVDDQRPSADDAARMMQGVLAALNGIPPLGIRVIAVVLPAGAPGDMQLETDKPYPLILDAYGNVADQLETLAILLADKANPPAGGTAWSPQYIDLRTPGRVYYR